MSLKKDVTFARLLGWDKGTNVDVHHASVSHYTVTYPI